MRTVVRRVLDEGVLRDAEIVEQIEHLPHVLVVVDHRVVVRRLPAAGLPAAPLLRVREQVHVRGVEPHEPRLAGLVLPLDEVRGRGHEFVVAGLHALLRERAGVLDLLLADLAPARLHRLVVLVGRPAMHDATRAEVFEEPRVLRVVVHFRLFFGIEMVEIAEELVEAVIGRQHAVQVAEVVLAELPGGIALLLQQRRDGHQLFVHADRRRGNPDLRQPRPIDALPGDERRASRRAGLLAVTVGEQHPFARDAVDVRRLVAHQPVRIAAQVGLTDVVTPDDEDVWFLRSAGCGLARIPSRRRLGCGFSSCACSHLLSCSFLRSPFAKSHAWLASA